VKQGNQEVDYRRQWATRSQETEILSTNFQQPPVFCILYSRPAGGKSQANSQRARTGHVMVPTTGSLDKTNSNPLRACRSGLSVLTTGYVGTASAGVKRRGVVMKLWRLLGLLLLIGCVSILSACGDSTFDDEKTGGGVAFTPTPAPTPIPKLCGNGDIDPGEECDPPMDGACGANEECVCCLCLEPGEELGTREFTIARFPSDILSSLLNSGSGAVVGLDTLVGPLVLHAGRPDPNLEGEAACSAPVTLEQDAIFGFQVQLVGFACTKVFAEGSIGTIDCDGGTPHNVDYVIDSNGSGEESDPVIRTRLGKCCTAEDGVSCAAAPFELCDPNAESSECEEPFPVCSVVGAGPGVTSLETPGSLTVTIVPSSTLQDCDCLENATTPQEAFDLCPLAMNSTVANGVTFSPLALTTEITRGTALNPIQGGAPQEVQAVGQNFSCADWAQTDTEGIFVLTLPGLDQVGLDTINAVILGDKPTEP
jgi:hypothetical protein